MNYCEKCKVVCEEDQCPTCDSKGLRAVAPDDFCFLLECERAFGDSLEEALEKEGIRCELISCGTGVRSLFGLPLENCEVYVLYRDYNAAKEWVSFFSSAPTTEELKAHLLANFDKWNINSRFTARKIRKKLKLTKDADVLAALKVCVENATSIEDKVYMYSFENEGHGLAVKSGEHIFWFSAETYKILI